MDDLCPFCLFYPITIELPVYHGCCINVHWCGGSCFWCGRFEQYGSANGRFNRWIQPSDVPDTVYRKADVPGPPPPPMPQIDEDMIRYTKYPY